MPTRQIVAMVLLLVFVGLWIGLKQMTPPPPVGLAPLGGMTPLPVPNRSGVAEKLPAPEESAKTTEEFEFPTRNPFDLPPLLRDQILRREEAARQRELAEQAQGPTAPPVMISLPELTLQGIFWGVSNPRAIINRQIVGVGDAVEDCRVVNISKEGVQLSYNNQPFLLTLPIRSGKEERS